MAIADEDPSDQPPRRTVAERFADLNPVHAGLFGAAMWVGAITALILFTHGRFLGPVNFTLTECLLIGAGCLGSPILIARFVRDELTSGACLGTSATCAVATVMLTVLIGAGQLRVSSTVAAFSVIMPEAVAVQAFNASDAATRKRNAVLAERRRAKRKREHAVQTAVAEAEAEHGRILEAGLAEAQREHEQKLAAALAEAEAQHKLTLEAALAEAKRGRDEDVQLAYYGALRELYDASFPPEELLRRLLASSSVDMKAFCVAAPEAVRAELETRGEAWGYRPHSCKVNGFHLASVTPLHEVERPSAAAAPGGPGGDAEPA